MVSFFTGYEEDIRRLWDDGYFKSEEDEVALSELLNEKGEGIANAAFIHPTSKIAHDPASEEDVRIFERSGYEVVFTDKNEAL